MACRYSIQYYTSMIERSRVTRVWIPSLVRSFPLRRAGVCFAVPCTPRLTRTQLSPPDAAPARFPAPRGTGQLSDPAPARGQAAAGRCSHERRPGGEARAAWTACKLVCVRILSALCRQDSF
ncbi:hypothetical protein VFPFJ_08805 [Purpureocillium lilacinum]|uniref:Uncharacterized protein n=1 Tax=Purpureocillium lilacinum TaxID=33203 RepID=A0A179GYX5_PURLI|nr:hypothetical protein VFPFJ_08805 [Purpureocillium lilacinum]OAQ83002.1 hypothetical protein VFPFJ_08805 [Purpureocillium lilacinum]